MGTPLYIYLYKQLRYSGPNDAYNFYEKIRIKYHYGGLCYAYNYVPNIRCVYILFLLLLLLLLEETVIAFPCLIPRVQQRGHILCLNSSFNVYYLITFRLDRNKYFFRVKYYR